MEKNGKYFAVENVISIPFSRFPEECDRLPRDRPLILADSVGVNSKKAFLLLQERGYTEIANLNGGIVDWERDGLPTKIIDDEMLIGQCACKLRPKKIYRSRRTEEEARRREPLVSPGARLSAAAAAAWPAMARRVRRGRAIKPAQEAGRCAGGSG
jgi:hypothetical protein